MQSEAQKQATRQTLQEAVKTQHVSEIVPHARTLLESGKASDTIFCATVFKSIAGQLVNEGYKQLNTYLVRSVTIEPALPFLEVESVLAGYVLNIQLGGFGSYVDDMLNPQSALGQAQPDLVIVLLDLEDMAGGLADLCADGRGEKVEAEIDASVERIEQMLRAFRLGNSGRLVLSGVVVPVSSSLGLVGDANVEHTIVSAVWDLNRKLARACRRVPDCVFFDVEQVAAHFGRQRWTDARLFLSSRVPFSPDAFGVFAKGLARTFSAMFRPPRKVLCTDLDNTLWGGILGEEGPYGIATGAVFPGNCYLEYQRYLKHLAARGILLTIASKNNAADVEEMFRLRSADLAIHLDDFVGRRIGWIDKVEAVRELAQELNLGLDSFVFVDDNPRECEAMRQGLPEVATVLAPADEPWKLKELLTSQAYFDTLAVTADDVNRPLDYKAQAQRAALGNGVTTRCQFLHSLGIVCTFLRAVEAPLARSAQLLAKTNQFNLTTRRYSAVDVDRFTHSPEGLAVAVRVRDRFGDLGVVGLVLASKDQDACRIDSLLLSCRVIGRGIETALLAYVGAHATATGCRWIIGEYIESKKNSPCADFYPGHGFERDTRSDSAGSVFYRLDLMNGQPGYPSWLTLEGHLLHELEPGSLIAP
jgi:FkbH-like protein